MITQDWVSRVTSQSPDVEGPSVVGPPSPFGITITKTYCDSVTGRVVTVPVPFSEVYCE